MADNASITILRNTQANINAEPIKDGNILFTTDQSINVIYTDVGTRRIKIGGTVPIDSTITANSTNPVTSKAIYTEVDDVRGQICTNLLNPTAQTQTINGVTLTNNGDGTYTLNGTASEQVFFQLMAFNDFAFLENKKLIGCPAAGSLSTYYLYINCSDSGWLETYPDFGNGVIISNIPSKTTLVTLYITILGGQTVNNLLFKPMLTTDLSATYSDFVPYTGGSGRLNEDVADVTSKLQNLQVGGRNLITDSEGEFSGEYPNNGWYISLGERSVNLPAYATQFVLSFEAKSTVAGDIIRSFFYNPSDIIKTEGSNGFISYADKDGKIEYTLTTNWTRYWVKWTAPVAETRNVLPCRLLSGDGTGTVSIRNIKFETGNTPTDWTPALEDLADTPITNSEIDTILNS